MKLFIEHPNRGRLFARQPQGFTLVEFYISNAIFISCVIMGLFAVHLMGLREEQLLESKAGASDSARRQINQLRNDIYGAKGWQVGSWNGSSFVAVTNNAKMQGNALMIYPLIMTSNQVVNSAYHFMYYFDSNNIANSDGHLCYVGTNGNSKVLVSNLIAPLNFTCEKFDGTTSTNLTYKSVIHVVFQYSQFQYPLTPVGSNCLFDTYRIDVRATPHLPDGS